jgi:DNA-binding transcriptional MerR regulator
MAVLLISDVARKVGICSDTIRSYCRQGLLSPIRDSSGRRLFTDSDVARVRAIYLDNKTRRPTMAAMA